MKREEQQRDLQWPKVLRKNKIPFKSTCKISNEAKGIDSSVEKMAQIRQKIPAPSRKTGLLYSMLIVSCILAS
jgi:hypothetical protein